MATHEVVITALLCSKSYEEARQMLGMTLPEFSAHLHDPEFQAAYRDTRRQVVDQAILQLQLMTQKATEILGESLEGKNRASTRLTAAQFVLDTAIRGAELSSMEDRLQALEQEQDSDESWD